MSTSTRYNTPGWIYVVLGLSLGFNFTSSGHTTLESILEKWQSFVNRTLVPLYSLCVFVYLGSLLSKFLLQTFSKRKEIPTREEQLLEEFPEEEDDFEGHCNMNGTFKLVKNENYESFLEAQGVPWALRRAANAARPTHKYTHRGNTILIHIQGIIESQTTYQINGPPTESAIRGRKFRDTMKYLESGDGIETHKEALTEAYDLVVKRQLSSDRKSLTMTSRAVFRDDKEPVESIQTFERVE